MFFNHSGLLLLCTPNTPLSQPLIKGHIWVNAEKFIALAHGALLMALATPLATSEHHQNSRHHSEQRSWASGWRDDDVRPASNILPPLSPSGWPFHHDPLQSSVVFCPMSDPEKNRRHGRPRRFQIKPLSLHHGPHCPGGRKHPRCWGLRPGRGGGQVGFGPQYRPLLPHRRPGFGDGRPLLCWIWGPSAQDGVRVSVHVRYRWRAVGLHHRLEPHFILCDR